MAILISCCSSDKRLVKKLLLIIAVVANLAMLFVYKYFDLAIDITNKIFHTQFISRSIALPIRISFFSFQALSYVIDVYRNRVKCQKNPFFVALYISFFPQLIAGPIVRYSSIEKQIIDRCCSEEDIYYGVNCFIKGLCKKVIFANNLISL